MIGPHDERAGQDVRPDPVRPKGEGRDHPEIAAATADAPEQVRVLLVGRVDGGPGRGHDVDREQVVHGQSVGMREPPEAAAEGEPRDARPGHDPDRHRETERFGGAIDMAQRGTGRDTHFPRVRVHDHVGQVAQVEHDAAVDGAVSGHVVTAATDRQGQPEVPGRRDRPGDVGDRAGPDDRDRMAVDHAVPDGARLLIGRVGSVRSACHRSPHATTPACPSPLLLEPPGPSPVDPHCTILRACAKMDGPKVPCP